MRFPSLTISRPPRTPWPPEHAAAPIASLPSRNHAGLPVHASSPVATARFALRFLPGRNADRCLVPASLFTGQGPAHTAFPGGDLPWPVPVRQWRPATIFRRRARAPGFASRSKIAARRHPPLRFGPAGKPGRVPAGSGPGKGIAVKAAMGAVRPANRSLP